MAYDIKSTINDPSRNKNGSAGTTPVLRFVITYF